MKLAVLMSCYNGERFLRQQIDSILAQQCDAQVELWVRDDGSTDGTAAILQSYADAGKLRWYQGENCKPAKSFLDLVRHCEGYDFYAFADQDDVWYPEKLQAGLDRLKSLSGPGLAFANAHLVSGDLSDLGRNVYQKTPRCDFYSLLCGANVMGCTAMFNRALADLVRGVAMPEKLIMHDVYLAVLCALFDGTVVYDPAPYMDYRQHGANAVGAQWTKWAALKNRLHRITGKAKVSISEQAQSLLTLYPDIPNENHLQFLKQVCGYRRNIFTAAALACSRKPRYNSRNMAVTMRLAIFLRNR